MISYDDYKKLLFPGNYIGDLDGIDETYAIPSDQTVNNVSGKYVITFSFFESYSDITLSSYYSANTNEAQHFIDGESYNDEIQYYLENIVLATSVNNPQYVWFQDVANITFTEKPVGTIDVNGDGEINQIGEYTTGHIAIGQLDTNYNHFSSNSAITVPYDDVLFPDNTGLKHGDIFFNVENNFWEQQIEYKTQQFKVLLEETLHSLGVDTRIPTAIDTIYNNQKYSVAAYNIDYAPGMRNYYTDVTVAPHTLQIMDIAALQEIYGRNYGSFAWGTDYTLSVMNPTANDDAFLYTVRRQSILDTAHKNIRCASGSLV